eukprot:9489952-Pyramimonas_sp.AAC.1
MQTLIELFTAQQKLPVLISVLGLLRTAVESGQLLQGSHEAEFKTELEKLFKLAFIAEVDEAELEDLIVMKTHMLDPNSGAASPFLKAPPAPGPSLMSSVRPRRRRI